MLSRLPFSPRVWLPLLAALIVAGCQSPAPSPEVETEPPEETAESSEPGAVESPEEATPTAESAASDTKPDSTAAPEAPERPPIDPVAASVVARLAQQLQVAEAEITVAQVTRAEWPNACLGLAAEGEICAQVITPGYAVSLLVNEQRYDFRTDETGKRFRLAFAPLAEIGESLLTWNDTNSFAVLQIGTERCKIGQRGRPLLTVPLPSPQRAQELLAFLSRYAPLRARTSGGEIVLRGVGAQSAGPAECRQIAEWAGAVQREIGRAGGESPPDRTFVWRREGGIAGFCDELVVTRAGFATAWNCRESPAKPVATLALLPAELQQLYTWVDTLGPSEWYDDNGGTADALLVSLSLDGDGTRPLSTLDREAMLAFANQLVRRVLTEAPSALR